MQPQFITLPRQAKDITGQRFGRLVALGPIRRGNGQTRSVIWLCRCDCGNQVETRCQSLISLHTRSCGCLNMDTRHANAKHSGSKDLLYGVWKAMRRRCASPNDPQYPNYGGRGISVCDAWQQDYATFRDDVSRLPDYGKEGYSLDRIDNDANYEPGNVRWATNSTQNRNTRHSRMVTLNGNTQTVAAWAEEYGINKRTLTKRLNLGWSIEAALNTPVKR